MTPWGIILRAIILVEDRIVESILRQPTFHRAVRAIHRRIHERKYGRDPSEPMYQGEASADPTQMDQKRRFLRYFFEELRNQIRGPPTKPPSPKK